MNTEEKAKRYDDALEITKTLYCADDVNCMDLETIFPELKESEDEKVEKAIFGMVYDSDNDLWSSYDVSKSNVLAWLEKQGKNKGNNKLIWKHWSNGIAGNGDGEPIYLIKTGNTYSLSSCLGFECDYIELSELDNLMLEKQGEQNHFEQDLEMEIKQNFKIGDWITDGYLYNKITDVLDDRYIVDTKFAKRSSIPFKFENYYHLWTLKDAKDGDVLATSAGAFIYNGNNGGGSCPGCYCGINTLGRFQSGVEHHWTGKKVYPATKEQRDLLFQKMREAGYEWDAEKKELKLLITNGGDFESENCEQKPDDMTESKFNVGDWVIYKNDICQIVKREEGCNKLVTTFGIEKELVNERNLSTARLWTIADAKKGDILADKYGVYIYGQLDILDESACVSICGYQYSDKKFEPESMICNKSDFYPATKEQRDTLFTKMHEAGYMWDSKSKQLLSLKAEPRGEQKPAWSWSEEDENKPNGGIVMEEFNDGNGFYKVNLAYLNEEHVEEIEELVKRWGLQPKRDEDESIISDLLDYFDEDKCLKHEVNDIIKWLKTIKPQQKGWGENEIKMLDNLIAYLDGRKDLLEEIKETYIDWLKSLKDRVQPQSQWKPSEEQIIALEYIINNACNTSYSCKIAKELLEQLKKLKV